MQNPQLPIRDMDSRHTGLTQNTAAYLHEGARVCLDRHHKSPTQFEVKESNRTINVSVEWEATDAHTRDAWANAEDTTREGAYACVLASVELIEGLSNYLKKQFEIVVNG